jgi:endonuclease/exonuclease/phosphatase family metal-dependent hydrolase
MNLLRRLLTIAVISLFASVAVAQEQIVRVASYNIKFLSTEVASQGDRRTKLQEVIRRLDADVIGLQEIADRAALNLIFPPSEWHIVIDDDSGDTQDVAVVVRKPLRIVGVAADLDADDQNFLFPGAANNTLFPNRRDLLFVEIGFPNQTGTFFVMVHHAKARVGGRATTDPRREGAAEAIVNTLKDRFEDKNFILLGDFNDNPDDRSLNIMETGDPSALGGPEEIDGPFLLNLMEPLVAEDQVSHGRNSADIVDDRVNTVDSGSRERNDDARGTNQNTGDILFDQLLIPGWMGDLYVEDSARVFDQEVAVEGNNTTRASDHLPVYADFDFGTEEEGGPGGPNAATARIVSLLPNPVGEDARHEEVTIGNFGAAALNLSGWKLRDSSAQEFALSGTVPAGAKVTITMTTNTMPLTNSGDAISLIDPQGGVKHHVSYTSVQAKPGQVVTFQ